ncbi:hypothetical protein AUJ68_07305 [Candidatus Woesearchaeota archaeon CG1_02_57_44]|nr:MAG: hypothetical protein AUJ68_07305 [Candidatus Woesearchaeota archaeon CG1_02_57_44]
MPAQSASADYAIKPDPYSSHSVILRSIPPSSHVLDIGCWDGALGAILQRDKGCMVTGIEGHAKAAAKAKHCLKKAIHANIETHTFTGSYDAIIIADVLEHLRNPEQVLRRAIKALKPQGSIIISVPNTAHLWIRLNLLLGRWEYADKGIMDRTHMRWFTKKTFLRLLRDADLVIESVTPTPAPLPVMHPSFRDGHIFYPIYQLSALLPRLHQGLFAFQFVAIARRQRR